MPRAVEDTLRRQGRKKGYKDDRLEDYIYSIMTEMQKKKQIKPWRKLNKH